MLNTSHMRCFFSEELRHSFNALDLRVLHTHTQHTRVDGAGSMHRGTHPGHMQMLAVHWT